MYPFVTVQLFHPASFRHPEVLAFQLMVEYLFGLPEESLSEREDSFQSPFASKCAIEHHDWMQTFAAYEWYQESGNRNLKDNMALCFLQLRRFEKKRQPHPTPTPTT